MHGYQRSQVSEFLSAGMEILFEGRAGRDGQLGNPVVAPALHPDAHRPEAVFPDEGGEVESAG